MNACCENERVERHKCLKDWTQANACNELDNDNEVESAGREEKKTDFQSEVVLTRLTLRAVG